MWIAKRALGLFTLSSCAALGLAFAGGSLASGFGAFEDEPAHVTTALMLRDWCASLDLAHPLRFAEDYYAHYPKVAIGQWPPVFHVALAGWLLALGVSSLAIALFGWTLLALTATCVGLIVARELDARGGGDLELGVDDDLGRGLWDRSARLALPAAASLVVVAAPLMQTLAGAAMTELPMALVGTLAVLAFGRWIEAPSARRALAFGGAAVLAILTKGSGLALALVPPLALCLARRPRLALHRGLWLAPLVVVAVCAPWYSVSLPITRATWSEGTAPSLDYVRRAFTYYPPEVVRLGGAAVLVLAILGLLRRLTRAEVSPRTAALAAWLVALGTLHAAIPSSLEARHLVVGLPALIVFAALGAHACVRAAIARGAVGLAGTRRASWVAASLLLLPFAAERFEVARKDWQGYDAAARAVRDDPSLYGDTILVASGATGEGLAVVAFALDDTPRRSRQVLRASKVLASETWIGADYHARFDSPELVGAWLASVPVAAVLLDGATPARHARLHLDQLRAALEADRGWRLTQRFDVVQDGRRLPGALELWISPEHAQGAPRLLGLDEVLGRDLPKF